MEGPPRRHEPRQIVDHKGEHERDTDLQSWQTWDIASAFDTRLVVREYLSAHTREKISMRISAQNSLIGNGPELLGAGTASSR